MTLSCKSNYTNTIKNLYNEDEEMVKKLEFYDPTNNTVTIYDLKPITEEEESPGLTYSPYKLKRTQENKNSFEQELLGLKASKEGQREKKRIYLEEKISELKRERNLIFKRLSQNLREKEKLKVSIEFVEKFDTFFPNDVYGQARNFYDQDNRLRLISEKSKAIIIKENELTLFKQNVDELSQIKDEYKEELETINHNIMLVKKDLATIKNELLVDYHKKLFLGKDTKEEGLVWIIKAIWNLGYHVIVALMPPFLDQDCIDYLFTYAKTELEHQRIREEIQELKVQTNNFNPNAPILIDVVNSTPNIGGLEEDEDLMKTFKTELKDKKNLRKWIKKKTIKGVTRSPIKKLKTNFSKEHEKVLTDPSLSFKKLTEVFKQSKMYLDPVFENFKNRTIDQLTSLENREENVLKKLKTLKRNEINRLRDEFFNRHYERRYRISLLDMLSVIVGQSLCHIEYTNIERDYKLFQEKLRNIKTYDFLAVNVKLPKI